MTLEPLFCLGLYESFLSSSVGEFLSFKGLEDAIDEVPLVAESLIVLLELLFQGALLFCLFLPLRLRQLLLHFKLQVIRVQLVLLFYVVHVEVQAHLVRLFVLFVYDLRAHYVVHAFRAFRHRVF